MEPAEKQNKTKQKTNNQKQKKTKTKTKKKQCNLDPMGGVNKVLHCKELKSAFCVLFYSPPFSAIWQPL